MNVSDFFNMGGYALYVWTAYGLMAVLLVWNLIVPIRQRRETMNRIGRLLKQPRRHP